MHVLDAIGNTSLVRLRRVVPQNCADILAKLEWENPTGSVKDRVARAMIARAEADGCLRRGGSRARKACSAGTGPIGLPAAYFSRRQGARNHGT